jgi:hypothetical protein
MRKLIVPSAMLAMALLLGAAVAIDCVRLARDGWHRVELTDAELVKNEFRLANVMDSSPKATPEVHAAVAKLRSAKGRGNRVDAYDLLVAILHNKVSTQMDPTNPLDRKFMDEAAGAMNRREVAQKQYEEESAANDVFMKTWRGRVALSFSGSK